MNNVRLTPQSEQLLQEQLARGPYRSSEEVIEPALETLVEKESASSPLGPTTKSPAEAVVGILEIQKRTRLFELKIKDLIHEGHKYYATYLELAIREALPLATLDDDLPGTARAAGVPVLELEQ